MSFWTLEFPAAGIYETAGLDATADPGVTVALFSGDELRGVFLVADTSYSGGGQVEPVALKAGAARAALETYWRSLVFTGAASMAEALAPDAGAVESFGAARATAGVKTLEVN
jgi:hypothetical protein